MRGLFCRQKLSGCANALAEKYSEHGLSAFLSERIDEHRKHGWPLYSSMEL